MRKTEKTDILTTLHEYSIRVDTREIWIHGDIKSDTEEIDYKTAVQFEKNFRFLESISDKKIIIHLHSIGGSWYDGFGIYDCIKTSKNHVTILVHSQASSIASVILQAADTRILMPNSHMVIHYGQISVECDPKAFAALADKGKEDIHKMISVYSERCIVGENFVGKSEKDIEKFIQLKLNNRTDWYLNAEEAVFYGFADGIYGESGFDNIYV